MSKEKIPDFKKKSIANMNLRGNQFKLLADVLGVSESTTRKASKIGGLLNKIDELEYSNRFKDVQISLLKTQNFTQFFNKTKRH